VNGLQLGYFKGLKYNINDTQYNKALTTLLNSMAGSQKVSLVVSTAIYKTYWSLAKKNGVPQQTYYDLFLAIARKTHINDTFNS
jgi:cytochrome bd-type quinol oxidase subunit 2